MPYKWIALSNTTLGILLATVNQSIVIISLPAIFRGIGLDPLAPGNTSYLLWMLMGYLLVSAVLVVTLGRLGDMLGRVKIYNLGFVVFTVAAILLSAVPFSGSAGAIWLIGFRIVQGVGGAMLMANSTAILTDAFSPSERGMALGINQVAALAGSFIGLVAGGLLSEWDWRLVFLVSVPLGVRRHALGVPVAARDRGPARGQHRLVGQRDVRGRADRGAGRHHVRDPAVRRAHRGLDQPVGAHRDVRRASRCSGCSCSSSPGCRARCSRSACSRSARSRPATSPRCCPRSPAAACSSC